MFAHVRVRLKHETEWREGRIADVFTFRNGKAIQFRTFADKRQALPRGRSPVKRGKEEHDA
jgi:ketosteroid isomerase-like protein